MKKNLYQKINNAVPANSENYRKNLRLITQNPQQHSRALAPSLGAIFMQVGLAASVVCFVFSFSLNVFLTNIKTNDNSALEISQSFFNSSTESLLTDLGSDDSATVDQILSFSQ
jgi:hypothetical protein